MSIAAADNNNNDDDNNGSHNFAEAMFPLLARADACVAFIHGSAPQLWESGLLFSPFPRAQSAARWGTCVVHGRAEVMPGHIAEIKAALAADIVERTLAEAGVSIDADCLGWIGERIPLIDAELGSLDADFDAVQSKFRRDVCDEAYGGGGFDEARAGRIAALNKQLRALNLARHDMLDERDTLVRVHRVLRALLH